MKFKQSLIENQSVSLQAHAEDWREAITIGTDMLIKSGAITADYHDAIIRSIETLGSYIIIAPALAMPHARPEDGVNYTAFALVTLSRPVQFPGESFPVDVLITLAGGTSGEHMEGLMEMSRMLEDDKTPCGINLNKLRQCTHPTQIYQLIDDELKPANLK